MDEFELQQRLKDAVQGQSPDAARLWENIMDESAHARTVRNAKRTGILLTVLALAIAVPVGLALVSGDETGIIQPGPDESPTPSSQPTPVPTASMYVDTQLNVAFEIPDGWRISEFEGHRIIGPQGAPLPPEDGDTVAMQMTFGDLAPEQGRTSETFKGYPAEQFGDATSSWIVVEWPASPLCPPCEPGPITIWWEASSQDEWQEHQSAFRSIVASLLPLYDENGTLATLTAAELRGRRGVATGVEVTGATITAIDFLDRRMWMEFDYDMVLSAEGKAAYDSLTLPGGEKRLEPADHLPREYTIVSADAADANSYEVLAEIVYEQYVGDDVTRTTVTERMFIGPGTSSDGTQRANVVRGAVDEA